MPYDQEPPVWMTTLIAMATFVGVVMIISMIASSSFGRIRIPDVMEPRTVIDSSNN